MNEVDANDKKYEAEEQKLVCTDDKSQLNIKKDDDKWKPVVDGSENDKLLMPPPGGFLRPSAGENYILTYTVQFY